MDTSQGTGGRGQPNDHGLGPRGRGRGKAWGKCVVGWIRGHVEEQQAGGQCFHMGRTAGRTLHS